MSTFTRNAERRTSEKNEQEQRDHCHHSTFQAMQASQAQMLRLSEGYSQFVQGIDLQIQGITKITKESQNIQSSGPYEPSTALFCQKLHKHQMVLLDQLKKFSSLDSFIDTHWLISSRALLKDDLKPYQKLKSDYDHYFSKLQKLCRSDTPEKYTPKSQKQKNKKLRNNHKLCATTQAYDKYFFNFQMDALTLNQSKREIDNLILSFMVDGNSNYSSQVADSYKDIAEIQKQMNQSTRNTTALNQQAQLDLKQLYYDRVHQVKALYEDQSDQDQVVDLTPLDDQTLPREEEGELQMLGSIDQRSMMLHNGESTIFFESYQNTFQQP